MVEANLFELFSLRFVTREYAPRGDLRIDTLAYDEEQKNLVIIEYKKGSSQSVIDQGYAYLSLMLNHKADFVLKVNECLNKSFNLKDINWEASRVVFISPRFNPFQREALGFQDLPFELWEIGKCEGKLITFNQLQASKRSAKLSEVKVGGGDASRVQREVKAYTVDSLFKNGWEVSRRLCDAITTQVQDVDARLMIVPRKSHIGIQLNGLNVVAVNGMKSSLKLHFPRSKPEKFNDPEKRVTYFKNSMKYYNNHVSQFMVTSDEDVQYALHLIKQAIKWTQ